MKKTMGSFNWIRNSDDDLIAKVGENMRATIPCDGAPDVIVENAYANVVARLEHGALLSLEDIEKWLNSEPWNTLP